MENIVPACFVCNSRKGQRTPEEFASYLGAVAQKKAEKEQILRDRTRLIPAWVPTKGAADMEIGQLVTPPEAACILGVRRSSVYHIATAGRLTAHKIGERVFFERAEVEALARQPRRAGRPRRPGGDADATT